MKGTSEPIRSGNWKLVSSLHLGGRIDSQIKIRSLLIELGGVDRPHHAGSLQLVAWINADADMETNPRRLQNGAMKRLPNRMMPTAVDQIEPVA